MSGDGAIGQRSEVGVGQDEIGLVVVGRQIKRVTGEADVKNCLVGREVGAVGDDRVGIALRVDLGVIVGRAGGMSGRLNVAILMEEDVPVADG